MPTVTFTGALPIPEDSASDSLIATIVEQRAQPGPPDAVLDSFRETTVWVEAEPDERGNTSVSTVEIEKVRWLPVFTSLAQLGLFAQASGRGDHEVHYGQLSGAEVLDVCLPALPHGTGVVLDPASGHVFALPPVLGIVPESLAVDATSKGEQ